MICLFCIDDLRQADEVINIHGRIVPAPPKFTPPSVPSPNTNKRQGPNSAKYVSQFCIAN